MQILIKDLLIYLSKELEMHRKTEKCKQSRLEYRGYSPNCEDHLCFLESIDGLISINLLENMLHHITLIAYA
jgi:hypothetical protein